MGVTDEVDVVAAKAERREYDRRWREAHPDKVKAMRERFLAKFAAQGEDTKAARRRYLREWRAANAERVRAIQLRYWAKRAAKRKAENGEEAQ